MTESTTSKKAQTMATATPSYDELQAQIKKLTEQAEAVRSSEIEAVLTDMKANIEKYGLSADQLGFAGPAKRAAKKTSSPAKEAVVMYKNKEGLTWSGAARGRKPKWVMEAQAAGEDFEKYRVK